MQAKDVMSAPVITVTPFTAVSDIAALLLERRISGVPVVRAGQLVGIVSESDLLHRHEIGAEGSIAEKAWWLRLVEPDPTPMHYIKSHGVDAQDIMTRRPVTAEEETPLGEIARLFKAHRIGRVPILHASRLVGIVTRADLVQAIATKRRSTNAPATQTDASIRERLLAELEQQSWWYSQTSNVLVTDGVVRYRGLVDSEAAREAARVAAQNVRGVRGVRDERVPTTGWQAMMQ